MSNQTLLGPTESSGFRPEPSIVIRKLVAFIYVRSISHLIGLECAGGGSGSGFYTDALKNVLQMGLYGSRADREDRANLDVCFSLRDLR